MGRNAEVAQSLHYGSSLLLSFNRVWHDDENVSVSELIVSQIVLDARGNPICLLVGVLKS